MSVNKNALIRYRVLDRCFSNFSKLYDVDDLADECTQALTLINKTISPVSRRQIYYDINFMESESGYGITLQEHLNKGRKRAFRYADRNFSIMERPLSNTEAEMLRDTLQMLNRFKGMPQLAWVSETIAKLNKEFELEGEPTEFVEFENNPYSIGLTWFTDIFNAIRRQQPLNVVYHTAFESEHKHTIHPYHLKQYRNRWYVYSLDENGKISNMALDRLRSIEPANVPYKPSSIDFNHFFDNVVGVSVLSKEVEHIVLCVDAMRYNYLLTQPIHHSQREISRTRECVTIALDLIPNYEFEVLLLEFADSITILEPLSLRDRILDRAKRILQRNDR